MDTRRAQKMRTQRVLVTSHASPAPSNKKASCVVYWPMEYFVLSLPFDFHGKPDFLHPTILKTEQELILIDCGYPGFLPLLETAAGKHGLALRNLTGVLITHDDIDHVGALAELKGVYPALKVYAPEKEAVSITGSRKSARLQQAEDLFDTLPEEHQAGARQFQDFLRSVKPVPVDRVISNQIDDVLFNGVRIVNTPGHTPGHISLFLEDTGTLIAADALVLEGNDFNIANPQFAIDLESAVDSVRKIRALQANTIVCYHGGEVRSDLTEKLTGLIDRYSDQLSG